MIYLASPYSHPLPEIRQENYQAVFNHALFRMRTGAVIFSPILYGHQFSGHMPWAAEDWLSFNEEMFLFCDSLEILMLENWQFSRGVAMEIEWARQQSKEITYVEPRK